MSRRRLLLLLLLWRPRLQHWLDCRSVVVVEVLLLVDERAAAAERMQIS